ncbi:hypothetical protein [Streptomyces sirii]|uniref:hypothetical protein n=1 Tax=Streptomyces sirii TaxID=3127701 RepID=UPI003D367503
MATLNDLEKRHKNSIEQLRETGNIEVVSHQLDVISSAFNEIPPPEVFEDHWSDLKLDDSMLRECLRFNEIAVHWESASPLPEFSGEYRIPSPQRIMGQRTDPAAESMSEPFQREFITQLRFFDHAYASSAGFMTFLRMVPGISPLEVWFHDLAGIGRPPYPASYIQLDLTYHAYVEALLLTKGLHGWQYLFADISFRDAALSHVSDGVRNALDVFPELFPDQDFTDLIQRLEARL